MPEGKCDGFVQSYTFGTNPTKYKMCGVVDGTCKPVTEATEDMPPMCDYCYTPVHAYSPTIEWCYQLDLVAPDLCIGAYQSYTFLDNPTKYKMCGHEGGKCVAVGEATEAMPPTCAMASPSPSPSPEVSSSANRPCAAAPRPTPSSSPPRCRRRRRRRRRPR